MIRNIDIKLNAAHPQLPILEATTFVGSPSAVMIHGVPPSVGAWRINAVRVVATYPDNTAHTVAAVLGAAGTWVATIPATETSGRVAQGLQIIADGTDERGESVTGYVLGIAGLAVYTRDMTIEDATGVKYYIHLLDAEPAEPKEGDAYLDGSTLTIYHDGEWTGIGGGSVELDNTVTRTSGNGVKSSGIWSAIWGALTALPGFSSLYDWCVAQLEKKYEKPQNGIPKTDLSAGVQASLDKADTALQTAPVTSVNGKTGAVALAAGDVGAVPLSDEVVYTERGIRAYYNTRPVASDLGILVGTGSAIHTFTTLYSNASISGWKFNEGTRATLLLPFPWVSKTENMLALLSDIAVKSVKLNGTALTPDANGAVNVPALPLTGGEMSGAITFGNGIAIINDAAGIYIRDSDGVNGWRFYGSFNDTVARLSDIPSVAGLAPLASPAFTGTPTAPTPASGDNSTKVATTAFVQNAVSGITPGPDNTKLNSTAAGPNFQTGVAYAVGKHVTYNGVLYECVVAIADSSTTPDQDIYDDSTTPATGHWKVTDMTDPDAVLDITSQNQLRVVAKDGTLLWAQGYDLASTSSATLACDAVNNFTFADGATTQAFTLPTAPSGKVGDFILDIDNSANKVAATISFTNITNNTASVVIPKGENLNDMLSIAAGELAELYFTKTTFTVNNLPTWKVVKQVVENGGAQS